MTATRFINALNNLNSEKNVIFTDKVTANFPGTWSNIHFYTVTGVMFTIERDDPATILQAELKVAVSELKEAKACYKYLRKDEKRTAAQRGGFLFNEEEETKSPTEDVLAGYTRQLKLKNRDILRAMQNLTLNHVPTRFNLPYLAYTSGGKKVSLMGIGDLYTFIFDNFKENKDMLTLEAMRRLIGQMVVAVSDLHVRDLTHRDIKLENFIIFSCDDKLFVRLSDHDEVLSNYQKSSTMPGTADRLPKELAACVATNNLKKYNALDKKALDCYALGIAIDQIVMKVFYFKESTDYEVEDAILRGALKARFETLKLLALVDGLLESDNTKQLTVLQARQHIFFGADEASRLAFFSGLLAEEANYHYTIDGRHQISQYFSIKDDFYLLLDTRIKHIFTMGKNMVPLLEESQKELTNSAEAIQNRTATLALIDTDLRSSIALLNHLIDERNDKADLINLKEVMTEELNQIELKKEELRIFKLLFIISDTLAQFSSNLSAAHRFFCKWDEINKFKQFKAKLTTEVATGLGYAKLVEAVCAELGEEKSIPHGSIKQKLNLDLKKSLGQSIYEVEKPLISEAEEKQVNGTARRVA